MTHTEQLHSLCMLMSDTNSMQMHAWCFKIFAHVELIYSNALCKCITLYVCMYGVCASKSNEPNTYQDDTCGLENISTYQKV